LWLTVDVFLVAAFQLTAFALIYWMQRGRIWRWLALLPAVPGFIMAINWSYQIVVPRYFLIAPDTTPEQGHWGVACSARGVWLHPVSAGADLAFERAREVLVLRQETPRNARLTMPGCAVTPIAGVLEGVDSLTGSLNTLARDSLTATVGNVNQLLARIDRNMASLETATASLSAILGKIDQGQGTLGKLINDDALYTRLDSTLINLNRILLDFEQNPKKDCSFGSLNGEIEVTFLAGLEADFRFKTFNGDVYTDFDISYLSPRHATTKRRKGKYVYKADKAFGARVGQGGPEMEFDGFNGDIYVNKK